VIGLSGHIVELDFPKKFKRWFSIAPSKLVDIEPEKRPESRGKATAIIGALKKVAKEAERVVIATDYDREGELIGVEALDILKAANKRLTFKRAQFSSLTPKEVQTAFEAPTAIDFKLAKSGESRQMVDLAWGVVRSGAAGFLRLAPRSGNPPRVDRGYGSPYVAGYERLWSGRR